MKDRQTDRQTYRDRANSKTLFSKDCSLGSFRPVYQLVLAKLLNRETERDRQTERFRDSETDQQRQREGQTDRQAERNTHACSHTHTHTFKYVHTHKTQRLMHTGDLLTFYVSLRPVC